MTVAALQKQSHEVIAFTPPSHKDLIDCAGATWTYDGGLDVQDSFKLSGEPMSEQILGMYGKQREQIPVSMVHKNNVKIRQLKKQYMDYWNSTAAQTSTKRPVDAIISPLAPFPAARPTKYAYYGYTIFVNLLDYTSVVVPITKVDKSVDVRDESYKPRNDADKVCYESCKTVFMVMCDDATDLLTTDDPEIYDGAHTSLQFVGRRLQEEKMLAIADLVDKALKA